MKGYLVIRHALANLVSHMLSNALAVRVCLALCAFLLELVPVFHIRLD